MVSLPVCMVAVASGSVVRVIMMRQAAKSSLVVPSSLGTVSPGGHGRDCGNPAVPERLECSAAGQYRDTSSRTMRVASLYLSSVICLLLTACGGGGSSGTPPPPTGPVFSLSTSKLSFSAAKPNSATPASQTVSASVTGGTVSGTLYVLIKASGSAVSTISNVVLNNANTGQASVTPVTPSALGFGTFSSTITVTACVNDPTCATGQLTGSPATVSVTYNIGSSVETDVVAPRVVPANTSGNVILRGHGFSAATSVHFGSEDAQSFTVINDSEIHATYPALPPGTYPISLNGGSIAFQPELIAVALTTQTATSLSYPSSLGVVGVQAIIYDAQRNALLVGVRASQSSSNAILRYAFVNGSWQAPTVAVVPGLRDMTLSSDGKELLAAVDVASFQGVAVEQIDPVTLQTGLSASVPATDATGAINIVLANDGNAIVTNGLDGSTIGDTRPLLYSASANTLTVLSADTATSLGFLDFADASGDGSIVLMIQGGLTTDQPVLKYTASTGIVSKTNLLLTSNVNQYEPGTKPATAPSIDTNGNRIILTSLAGCQVFDSNLKLLGTLPGYTLLGVIIRPDGTRAYVLDTSGVLHSYDLTTNVAGGAYPEVGTGVTIGTLGETETGRIHMAISPDGGTLYVAGAAGIVIQPSPP